MSNYLRSKRSGRGDDAAVKGGASKKAKKSSYVLKKTFKTGALVNVKNIDDEECFKWSVLAALHPDVQKPDDVKSYRDYVNELNFENLNFPIKKSDIPKFENKNQIGINLFGHRYKNSKKINIFFPIMIPKKTQQKTVELLLITNDETDHYCWIKDFSALMGDTKKHYCRFCLEGFNREISCKDHTRLCQLFEPQKVTFPRSPNANLHERYPDFILHAHYVIYADFKCIQTPAQGSSEDEADSRTVTLTDHHPSGYAYKVVEIGKNDSKPVVVYRGEKVVEHFMKAMKEERDTLIKEETDSENSKYNDQFECYICKGPLNTSRHLFYCPLTWNCYGKICWSCNSKYNEKVTVVIHDLTNYVGHFIVNDKSAAEGFAFCIPSSIDTYKAFTTHKIRFIDSKSFLQDSLSNLVSNLSAHQDQTANKDHFKHTFGLDGVKGDDNKLSLLLRKRVYPYDYMDSFSKFQETSLPDKTHFRSRINHEDIPEEDYQHAKEIWKEFNINNLGEYQDLYVKSDVLLLADVFENFRKKCKDQYLLDPVFLNSLSDLSWKAALKMTSPDLHLLTDREMYLMIESGIRGGVTMISQRFAKANNPRAPDYDSTKPKTYIIYFDANNLYGWAMSQYLPTGGFTWLTHEEIEEFKIDDVQMDAETGYILEVDLEYPKQLHDAHNDYPLAPENIKIKIEMLSPFTKQLFNELSKKESSEPKLVPSLRDKEKYVVHYRALQLYIEHGLKLKKIHRVVSFNQSPWLKPYIDYNTENRKNATNNSDLNMFKLMNNSIYGKTLENKREYRDVTFLTTETNCKKFKSELKFLLKKSFTGAINGGNDITAVLTKELEILLNKPICIGFSVLEISKTLIYDFHYNFIRPKYEHKARLLFTDTDSLCYEIETDDVYKDMLKDRDRFDTSDYPEGHQLQSNVNKKVVGKMKDETNGIPIAEFVGLKPKMYSLQYGGNGKICGVGVDKFFQGRKLNHNDYKECLDSRKETEIEQVKITSIGHKVHTVRERRKGLSPFDDKRYILDDGIRTLAYGHKDIPVADEKSSDAGTPM